MLMVSMNKLTVNEIKQRLKGLSNDQDAFVQSLSNDSRKGVQNALRAFRRRLKRQQEAQAGFQQRFKYEKRFWAAGLNYVAGVDEVGRGPLAGPVVTAAVILDDSFDLVPVTDSKQLSRQERESLYLKIVDAAVEVSIGVNDRETIDRMNILEADRDAMVKAVQGLHHHPQQLIVDAVKLPINIPQLTMYKADAKSISVAAASIVAKEYRDHLMRDYDRLYPQYGFKDNAGYGTAQHLQALAKYGVTPIHRRSFSPVKKFLNVK